MAAAATEPEKAYNWARSATISSATPLKHKDRNISKQKRERFESLDLEVLLNEFRAVAKEKEETIPEEVEEGAVGDDELAEATWLESVGLECLSAKIRGGERITEQDIKDQTQGLTPQQVQAIKMRVKTLNRTLRGTGKSTRQIGDAREIFAQSRGDSVADDVVPPLDAASMGRLNDLTETLDEPPTLFRDLGEDDQQHVQCLNLIQLTSILEANGKPVPSRSTPKTKTKKKKKKIDGKVFGVELAALVERDLQTNRDKMKSHHVPLFVTRIIQYLEKTGLEEEGLFRKAGSAARIKHLRTQCEFLNGDITFENLDSRPHDVSALLKQFLRDIPEPLLTDEYIESFAVTQQLEDPDLQFYTLQLLVTLLPPVNRECLRVLLDFLVLVAKHQHVNKMGVSNLAVVFAPTLFYVKGQKGQKMLKEVEMQVSTAATLKIMIENNDALWQVPPDIIAQVRFVNESRASGRKASKPKDVRKILASKKERKPSRAFEEMVSTTGSTFTGASSSVRWVHNSTEDPPVRAIVAITKYGGHETKTIKIYPETTAQHVLTSVGADATHCLREEGGNIGSRRLHSDIKILPLLQVNPTLNLVVFDC